MTEKNNAVTVQSAEQAVRAAKMKQVEKSMNQVHEALVITAKREDLKVLPEEIFKQSFLPYFSGQKPITADDTVMADWIGISGSPVAEVNIIDSAGNVLYTVPPILDTSIIETAKRALGHSFADIYAKYTMHSNNMPVIGERVFADEIQKKLPTMMKESSQQQTNQDRWRDILVRYSIDGSPQQKAIAQSKAKANPADDVEYD
jgi:hypothetical protein